MPPPRQLRWLVCLTFVLCAGVAAKVAAQQSTQQQSTSQQPTAGDPQSTAPAPTTPAPTTPAPTTQAPTAPPPPDGYVDEPPLDFFERDWRDFTRRVRPQRFSRRDGRRRYGYSPPLYPGYFGGGDYDYPYGGYGTDDAFGTGYIQGRDDQRRFAQWQQRSDRNGRVYRAAMTDGVRLFREADYAPALQAFVRAARLNQGDPASRVHATYALVALGNYDAAVLMIRRALQLQSRMIQLPLSIPDEYGPRIDFDAHLQRLAATTRDHPDDPGLWMLLGIYHYYSQNRSAAAQAFTAARALAPEDTIIQDLDDAARLYAPSHPAPSHLGPAHLGPSHLGPSHLGPAHLGPARRPAAPRSRPPGR